MRHNQYFTARLESAWFHANDHESFQLYNTEKTKALNSLQEMVWFSEVALEFIMKTDSEQHNFSQSYNLMLTLVGSNLFLFVNYAFMETDAFQREYSIFHGDRFDSNFRNISHLRHFSETAIFTTNFGVPKSFRVREFHV